MSAEQDGRNRNVCGQLYLDTGPACALHRDHPADLSDGAGPVHRAADGTAWTHHEELVGHDEEGHEVWDTWDEPFEVAAGDPG